MQEKSFQRYRQAYRRIHMDFHNPEFINDIGHDLDAKVYVKTLSDSAINSLVVFAKGHHGNCYYPTEIGHQHPALNQDILGNILKECEAQNIETLIYYSVAWDTHVQNENPEWLCLTKEGETISHEIWDFICLNSPYKRELLFPQLDELITLYQDVDVLGFWLDLCWMPPEGCYCDFCQRKFQREYGLSLYDATEAQRFAFLRRSVRDFIEECKRFVKQRNPDMLVSRNQVWLFGRPLYENAVEDEYRVGEYTDLWYVPDFMVTETNLHNLYDATISSRYFRGFGKPFEVLLTRFVDSWGSWDFVPLPHLITLGVQIASNGGIVSCGDQGYANGPLDQGVYQLIGDAMRYLQAREQWFMDKQEYANICVLADVWDDNFRGLTHMLMQMQYPFVIRDFKRAQAQDLDPYDMVIIPQLGKLNDNQRGMLDDYVSHGGHLLTCVADNGMDETILSRVFGVRYAGLSPYSIGYLDMTQFAEEQSIFQSVLLVQSPFTEFLLDKAQTLVSWKQPRVETTPRHYWRHPNSPPADYSDYPAITVNKYGKGQAMLVASSVLGDYWQNNHWYLKLVLQTLVKQLTVQPFVKTQTPHSNLEINVTRDGSAVQIHMLTFQEMPRMKHTGLISDNPRLADVVLMLHRDLVSEGSTMTLQPEGINIDYTLADDVVTVTLPDIQGYAILEIE